MNIVVFVKQVPRVDDVILDVKTGNIVRDGVESVMNPLDANAVEAAVCIREQLGGKVTAVSMGPPQAAAVLNRALAMGCDESVLLSDRAFGGADTLATGYVLSEAARKCGPFDLILCGDHSVDAETAQTGPIIAEFLGIPDITAVRELQTDGASVICRKRDGGRVQTIRVRLPALITVLEDVNSPRYPKPIEIMRAMRKPHFVWDAQALGCDRARAGAAGSPSVNKRMVAPETPRVDTVFLEGQAEEIARAYAEILEDKGLL
jgi:electron transfer flavoprotein beta subunit